MHSERHLYRTNGSENGSRAVVPCSQRAGQVRNRGSQIFPDLPGGNLGVAAPATKLPVTLINGITKGTGVDNIISRCDPAAGTTADYLRWSGFDAIHFHRASQRRSGR